MGKREDAKRMRKTRCRDEVVDRYVKVEEKEKELSAGSPIFSTLQWTVNYFKFAACFNILITFPLFTEYDEIIYNAVI